MQVGDKITIDGKPYIIELIDTAENRPNLRQLMDSVGVAAELYVKRPTGNVHFHTSLFKGGNLEPGLMRIGRF